MRLKTKVSSLIYIAKKIIKKKILITFFCLVLTISANNKETEPNIIFILADDLGYGDLSCYGQKYFSTPNIDQLAKDGILFTDYYAGSPVCAPSRCALMTGKHNGHGYVRGNLQYLEGEGQLPIPEDEKTFVKYLMDDGYKTGIFGKWGLGNVGTTGDPLKHGFHYFFGYDDQVRAHNSFPEYLIKNNEKVYLKNKVIYLSDTLWHKGLGSYSTEKVEYSNDIIFNELVNFIKKNKSNKFFAYFPTTIPHDNGEAPENENFEVPNSPKILSDDFNQVSNDYANLVKHLDDYVGKLVKLLDDLNISENTIIIFTSDNGAVEDKLQLNSNGFFRGYKTDVYEGGIRVPLIIKWPAKIQANRRTNHVSAIWDFFPTILDISKTDSYPKTDGISFLPTLLNQNQSNHDYLYWEFYWWKPAKIAARKGNWKAVKESINSEIELYDLIKDPSEKNNLASHNSDIVLIFKDIFSNARTESKHFSFDQ